MCVLGTRRKNKQQQTGTNKHGKQIRQQYNKIAWITVVIIN